MLWILPTALRALLTSIFTSNEDVGPHVEPLRFQLRQAHGVTNDTRIVFTNISPSFVSRTYEIPSKVIRTFVPESHAAFLSARSRSARYLQSESLTWRDLEVVGPHVEKRQTLLQLAEMTYDSYIHPGDKDWYTIGTGWNVSFGFGWQPDEDGFRGYVFATEDNSTVVISVKGTSAPWLVGGGGPTVSKDKLNDNILFSCCCARVGPTWSTVCGCHCGQHRCDETCLERSLQDDDLFYTVGLNLYTNVSYMYPNANIWLTGHSLGGGLAALLGATFGTPVVAFEAPAERLPAKRLHLPSPPSTHHITHVFNNADPIPMGACTGITSVCALGGYALETTCHLGKAIIYDTVGRLKWSVSVSAHPIQAVIDGVLQEDWDPEHGLEVPLAEEQIDCVDCYSWEFGDFQDSMTLRVLMLSSTGASEMQ